MIEQLKCITPVHLLIIPNKIWSNVLHTYVSERKVIRNNFNTEIKKYLNRATGEVPNIVTLDCGQCFACRRKKAFYQSLRLMLEAKYYEEHFGANTVNFISFTYDELLVPYTSFGAYSTKGYPLTKEYHKKGENKDLPVEISCEYEKNRFIRALKRKLSYNGYTKELIDNIKYFWINEYGNLNARPHYHCMLFGVDLFHPFGKDNPKYDMYNMEYNQNNNPQYFSRMLDNIWGKGRVTFSPFTPALANYISKYIVKTEDAYNLHIRKYYGIFANQGLSKEEIQKKLAEIEKPHSYKSNNLGKRYILEHKDDILKNQKIYIYGSKYNIIGYVYQVLKDEIDPQQKILLNQLYEKLAELELENHKVTHPDLAYGVYMRTALEITEKEYKRKLRQQLL